MITKNEAHNIEACLKSVSFADQIVVLDSGSADHTQQIARHLGAEVVEDNDWQGFGVQKNRALNLARCDWVFSIDADERVTPSLRVEILKVMGESSHDAYSIPRLSSYCGQYMMHSGWNPDYVIRLFRRGTALFSNDLVHEKILTKHSVGVLHSHLLHESFVNFEAVLDKVNRYSTAGAQVLYERAKSASVSKAITHGAWAFFRTYFLRRGFLDGRMGLVLAISNAEGTYYRYLKLWLLSRKQQDAAKSSASQPTSVSGTSPRP